MSERGNGHLYLRGSTWWAAYYVRGVLVRESTRSTNEKAAKKFLKKKLAELEVGLPVNVRHLHYEQLRDSFMEDYRTNERKSLRRDKNGAAKPLDKVQRLDGFFSGFRADEIDVDAIRKFQADQKARGLSHASINRSVSALRRMFHLAKRDGKLREIPYFPMLPEAQPRSGFLEPNDYETLGAALPDYVRVPLAIGYFTGLRLGEILRLRWNQINFLENTVTLNPGETKNGRGRKVPVVPKLRAILLEAHGRREPGCDYVCFRMNRLGHAERVQSFRKAWNHAAIKAGLGKMVPVMNGNGELQQARARSDRKNPSAKSKLVYEGIIFHDLRRSAVRNMIRAGIPEKIAMSVSGHITRAVFDRYNITSDADLKIAAEKLGAFHDENIHNSFTDSTEMQQVNSPIN